MCCSFKCFILYKTVILLTYVGGFRTEMRWNNFIITIFGYINKLCTLKLQCCVTCSSSRPHHSRMVCCHVYFNFSKQIFPKAYLSMEVMFMMYIKQERFCVTEYLYLVSLLTVFDLRYCLLLDIDWANKHFLAFYKVFSSKASGDAYVL